MYLEDRLKEHGKEFFKKQDGGIVGFGDIYYLCTDGSLFWSNREMSGTSLSFDGKNNDFVKDLVVHEEGGDVYVSGKTKDGNKFVFNLNDCSQRSDYAVMIGMKSDQLVDILDKAKGVVRKFLGLDGQIAKP